MKKYSYLLLAACMLYTLTVAAQPARQAKLSPFTRLFLADMQRYPQGRPEAYVYKQGMDGALYLGALLKVTSALKETDLLAAGVRTGTRAGNIRTVMIPVAQLQQVALIPGIEYIQIDEPVSAHMDAARRESRVDSVHAGAAPLTMPYTGKGVVVGVLDAGFDYNHPSLLDTSGSRFRVVKVWEQKTPGTPPSGFSFGDELTDSTAIRTRKSDKATFSHGAHVAGITAGSGVGSADNSLFRGIAYESDLVLVGITPDSNQWIKTGMTDFIDGMNYVYNYAASVGKPAVVNLSWGTTMGPHDGTSLFSQACDALTGAGKLFVCSGGNNGENAIHLGKTFTASDTALHTILQFPSGQNRNWLDIWGDTGKAFCVTLSLYNGFTPVSSTMAICLDDLVHELKLVGSDGDTCFITAVTVASEFNEKPRIFFRLHKQTTNRLKISVTAHAGTVNLWTGYVANATGYYGSFAKAGLSDCVNGNTDMTTGDVADTRSAVAVGSFASKPGWTNMGGGSVDYSGYALPGRIAPYSSLGPTADGRVKPDIAAPGLFLASAANSLDTAYTETGSSKSFVVGKYNSPRDSKDYYYAMMTGTSMASPVVAGIVALMLEANPKLTPGDVIRILKETAIHDAYTGPATATGSNRWGHGKINAFAAVNRAIESLGISFSAGIPALDCLLYPNPNKGSFHIRLNSHEAGVVSVHLLDVTGRTLYAEDWQVQAGKNIQAFNYQLLPGSYFTRVADRSGKSILIRTTVQ